MLTRLPSTQHCKDHRGRFRIPEEVEDPYQDSRSPSCSRPDLRQWLRRCSGPRVVVRQKYSHFHKPPGRKQEWSTNRTISLKAQDMERGNTRLTKNAWATVICVKDEDMVIWSAGDNLTTASFDGIFVTQNRRIEIAHRHFRSSVILKITSFHETYLGNAMINIWTVGFVEYFPGIRIVFTGGYVIVHEDHDILVFQAPSP